LSEAEEKQICEIILAQLSINQTEVVANATSILMKISTKVSIDAFKLICSKLMS